MAEALMAVGVIAGTALVIVLAAGLVAIFGPGCSELGWALRRVIEKRFGERGR